MEKNAATLQTLYRTVFETDITMGTEIISAKSERRDISPFASIDTILKDLEGLDDTNAYAG